MYVYTFWVKGDKYKLTDKNCFLMNNSFKLVPNLKKSFFNFFCNFVMCKEKLPTLMKNYYKLKYNK